MDWAWGAQIVRYLRSITPQSGSGVLATPSLSGTSLQQVGRVGSRLAASHPLRVLNASTTGPAAAKVRVIFGQVNSVTPTIGGTPISGDAGPVLTVVSGVVYLRVNLDVDGIVTSAVIGNAAALPAQTATEGYLTLAEVTVVSNAVTAILQSVTHSLGHQKCGVTVHNFWGL